MSALRERPLFDHGPSARWLRPGKNYPRPSRHTPLEQRKSCELKMQRLAKSLSSCRRTSFARTYLNDTALDPANCSRTPAPPGSSCRRQLQSDRTFGEMGSTTKKPESCFPTSATITHNGLYLSHEISIEIGNSCGQWMPSTQGWASVRCIQRQWGFGDETGTCVANSNRHATRHGGTNSRK